MLGRPERALLCSASLALAVFAFYVTWRYGHYGIFLLDHSIVFDGGYRVYLGQVPYKDIYMAYLPGALWVLALFFKLIGVGYSTIVWPAAVLNALGVLVVIRIVWLFFPGRAAAALAGGLLTSFWLEAQFGAAQHEQIGFFFALTSLWLIAEADSARRLHAVLRFAAGAAGCYGVLCKQNAGGAFIPVALALLILPRLGQPKSAVRACFPYLCGMAATAGAFVAWVWLYSDWAAFWRCTVEIPAQFTSERLAANPARTLRVLTLGGPFSVRYLLPALYLAAIFAIVWVWRNRARADRPPRALWLAPTLSLGLLFSEELFQATTENDPQNCVPYIGLVFALLLATLQELYARGAFDFRIGPKRSWIRVGLVSVATGAFLALAGEGFIDVRGRVVHFPRGTRYGDYVKIPSAARVRWAEPTLVRHTVLTKAEFEHVYGWLVSRPGAFFVYPDATLLYGLTGRVAPQPYLYFVRNHSYRASDLPAVDREVLAHLQRNNIRSFVLEREAFYQPPQFEERLPRVAAWIHSEFRMVKRGDLFELWERR